MQMYGIDSIAHHSVRDYLAVVRGSGHA